MAFTVADVRDLVRLLDEQPDWRAEVRRQLLTDELLAMPEQIAQQRRDIQRIEEQIARQRRDIHRIEGQLVEQRRATDRRFQQVEDQIAALTRTVDTLTNDVGELKGDSLERRYREKAGAYFGRLLRRTHVLSDDELNKLLDDAVAQGVLTEDECDEVIWADAIVRGRRRGDRAQVVAVAEVSWGVGIKDVERASRRADLLARVGFTTLPVVGGKAVTREAAELARQKGVWQLFDGRLVAPDAAGEPE
jgi:hypothetical protein